MKSINFNDGYKTYALNNDESNVIRINVTDFNMATRYEETAPKISALADKMKAIKDPTPAQISEIDARIREYINYIFGTDVCTPAFGKAHCMSVVGGGRLLFEGFLEALIEAVQSDMNAELASAGVKAESRTEKYTKPVLSMTATAKTESIAEQGMTLTEEQKAYCRQLMEDMLRS